MNQKISDLKNIQKEIKDHEKDIRFQLIKNLLERNFYLEKLREIEKLGEKNDWHDNTQLLDKIRDFFNSIQLNN